MKTLTFVGIAVLMLSAGCDPIVGLGCEQGYVVREGACMPALVADAGGSVGDGATTLDDGSVRGDAGMPVMPDAWTSASDDDAFVPDVDAAMAVADGGVMDPDAAMAMDPDAGSADPDAGSADPDAGSADPDAGTPPLACDLGESLCDASCVVLATDPDHCGDCDTACAADDLCADGVCVAACGPGQLLCDRACVDPMTSELDCGGCGIVCDTGICVDGACVGARAGHLVVIGHDFTESRASMQTLLSNSLGLTASSPRVAEYVGAAAPDSIAGVANAMSQARPVTASVVDDPTDVPLALASNDVLLVYAQANASADELSYLGQVWSRALATFLERGGTVVALDAFRPGDEGGAALWLSAAGLTSDVPREAIVGTIVSIVNPADALTVGLRLSYRAQYYTVHWLGSDLPVVIGDASGGVVFHRTVVP